MIVRPTATKKRPAYPVAYTAVLLAVLTLMLGFFRASTATSTGEGTNTMEEDIWKLEEAYFTDLYKAEYEGVLELVHPQFLGWPGNLPKPVGKEESAAFMKKLVPQPTPCAVRIERGGLQISGDTALTQYTVYVSCSEGSERMSTQGSRITHTWVMRNGRWQLLGGMSREVKQE